MHYHDPHKKNGTITTKVVCAVCFLIFSFVWLYWFQADVLAVAHHVLSGGVTHYDRTVGAVIITLTLFLLQLGVYAVTRLSRRTHALTYLPSMLVLAILSDVDTDIDRHSSLGHWLWLAPLILLLWGGAVWLARKMFPFDRDDDTLTGLLSQRCWMNLLQMALMMLFVALVGNGNAVFHFRAHAETAALRGDVDEMLRVGRRSHETDASLTMLRAYALARKGELGDRLFEYPVAGTGDNLLPTYSHLQILPPDTIWRFLGARPAFPMSAQRYFYCLEHDSLATPAVKDYVLCAYLMDRNLDAFVAALPRYYEVNDSLPRHYREALIVYQRSRMNPQVTYREAVIDEDWKNFRQLEGQYPVASERQLKVFEHYEGSYWYYYYYARP